MQKIINIFLVPDDNKSVYLAELEFDSKIRKIKLKEKYSALPDELVHAMKQLKTNPSVSESAHVIDGKYNLLIPAGIDPHVHFDEPGFTLEKISTPVLSLLPLAVQLLL